MSDDVLLVEVRAQCARSPANGLAMARARVAEPRARLDGSALSGSWMMAIRLRAVNGVRVALCAAETDAQPGDVYLDDADHYALAAKFCHDWHGRAVDWSYPTEWAVMATQRLRDAHEKHDKWLDSLVEAAARLAAQICRREGNDGR